MNRYKPTIAIFVIVLLISTWINTSSLFSVAGTSESLHTQDLELDQNEDPNKLFPNSGHESGITEDLSPNSAKHPLTRNETVLLPLDEFGILRPATTGVIFDDANNNMAPIATGIDINTGTYIVETGDFDGDGNDEILIADGGLVVCNVSLYDYENGLLTITWTMLVALNYYSPSDVLGWVDITAGDFDADGIDELAMLLSGRTDVGDTYINWVFLWAYDIQDNEHLVLRNVYETIGEEDGWKRDWLDIEAGDIDGDGADEIVLALAVWYEDIKSWDPYVSYLIPLLTQMSVFDDSRSFFTSLSNITYPLGINEEVVNLAPQLEVGDFNHDAKEEIALLVLPATEDSYLSFALTEVWIYDYDSLIFLKDPIVKITDSDPLSEQYLSPRTMIAADVDGDNQQELVLTGLDIYSIPVFIVLDHNESISNVEEAYYVSKLLYATDAGFIHGGNIFDPLLSNRAWITRADVDCDGKDEIVYSDFLGTTVLDDATTDYQIIFFDAVNVGPVLGGNFDGDGIRVKFTGNSWETLSPPGVIAVLVAPPTQYGIDQNYVSSYTAYGREKSGEETEGNSLGHSSSTSVSFELSIGIGLDWLGFSGFESAWTKTWAKESIKTGFDTKISKRSEMYATGSDHDVVVYQSTLYRSYEYEIMYHPINSSLVGAKMSLNVPVSSTIHHESVPYFNNAFKDKAPHIGNETLKHTIGKPWTYPSLADMGQIAPIGWRSGTQTIGQGSGWVQVIIDLSDYTGKTITRTKSSEYSTKTSIFGAGMGTTSASISGSLYEIIVGETSIYEGVVGDIADPDLFSQLKYDFGLIAYYMTHPDGPSYLVVNYWVENAVEYDPAITSSSTSISSETSTSISPSTSNTPSGKTSTSGTLSLNLWLLVVGTLLLLVKKTRYYRSSRRKNN